MSDDAATGEFDLIARIRQRIAAQGLPDDVVIGPGDDAAALLPPEHERVVVSTDMLVEGRHFDLDVATPADIGWKTVAVSVSDIAAMGARARWVVIGLALPADGTAAFLDGFLDGALACAAHCGVSLVGGDLTASSGAVVSTGTVMGTAWEHDLIKRSGAQLDDVICVTGQLGGSLSGRHLRPEPRQKEALSLVQRHTVHAMIDLSDGLSSDLGHILDASGVGAALWSERIPIHADAAGDLERALHDGEDFELCFCVSVGLASELTRDSLCGTPVACIGRITEDPGLILMNAPGEPDTARPLRRGGHDHFRTD